MNFRQTGKWLGFIISALLVAMAAYHFYASGFGLVRELLHRGIHISFVFGLGVSVVFLATVASAAGVKAGLWYRPGGISLLDFACAIAAVAAALYLPLLPPEIVAFRVGNPAQIDVIMGTILLVLVLELCRRSIGPTLPLIALVFILFALYGPFSRSR